MTLDSTAYYNFRLTPDAGFVLDLSSFVYTGQASGTGPTSFSFRSSLDNFASGIGAPTAAGATINLSGASFQNLTTPIEFRLYAYGASATGGSFSVNDFTFNGIVVPEPASLSLLTLGGLVALRPRRRIV